MINTRFIFLTIVFTVTILAKTFSASGSGGNIKNAKKNALKNLSEYFYVEVNSKCESEKSLNNKNFSAKTDCKLDISSKINLFAVRYETISNNIISTEVKATILEKDIISYLHNFKLSLKNIDYGNSDELRKVIDDIENIKKIFLVVNMPHKESFMAYIQNKYKKIANILYDARLVIPKQKNMTIYINGQETNAGEIFIEPNKKHTVRINKLGHFNIENKIYLRSGKSRILDLDFIKKRKMKIKLTTKLVSDFNLISKALRKYKITLSRKSKILFDVYFNTTEDIAGDYVNITVNGKIIVDFNKKNVDNIVIQDTVNRYCEEYDKNICLKSLKKKTVNTLIKGALRKINEN